MREGVRAIPYSSCRDGGENCFRYLSESEA
jgi:hypothetical protein